MRDGGTAGGGPGSGTSGAGAIRKRKWRRAGCLSVCSPVCPSVGGSATGEPRSGPASPSSAAGGGGPGPYGEAPAPHEAGVPRPAERRPLPCGAPGAPVTEAVYLQSRPWKEEKCKRRESERGKELPELRE